MFGLGRWFIGGLFCAFAFIILLRLLRGEIRLDGLLRVTPEGPISFERLQMLATTLAVLGAYLLQVTNEIDVVRAQHRLPEPSEWVLAGLGGSNVFFLAIKSLRNGALRGML